MPCAFFFFRDSIASSNSSGENSSSGSWMSVFITSPASSLALLFSSAGFLPHCFSVKCVAKPSALSKKGTILPLYFRTVFLNPPGFF